MSETPLRIIQISDTHLYANEQESLLGVETHKSLEAVLDLIQENAEKFDLILHSGDLTQDYSKEAYVSLADMLNRFEVPVYCIPGNHDDPILMANTYPCGRIMTDRHIVSKYWQIILLDSHQPSAVHGYLKSSELSFLENCLQAYPEHLAIVVFHHQPVMVGSAWLDNLGLKNADEFWAVISQYPKLKIVLFGHVHQQYETINQHIACYSAPSTCIQFMRNQNHFGLENIPQGYRWLHLYPDGHYETAVVRLKSYIGQFDPDAKGY